MLRSETSSGIIFIITIEIDIKSPHQRKKINMSKFAGFSRKSFVFHCPRPSQNIIVVTFT